MRKRRLIWICTVRMCPTTRIGITKTRLFEYTENFTAKKWKFSDKKILIFFIFLLKNIHCGYSLEPPRWGGSDEYPQSMFLSRNKKTNVHPCKSQFYYIKVGFKGVKTKQACFHDGMALSILDKDSADAQTVFFFVLFFRFIYLFIFLFIYLFIL